MNSDISIYQCKAKAVDSHKWVTGFYARVNGDHYILSDEYDVYPIIKRTEIDSNTLCRNTGIRTYSGTPVFEGDMLDHQNSYVECNGSGEWQYSGFPLGVFRSSEVTGNRFDYYPPRCRYSEAWHITRAEYVDAIKQEGIKISESGIDGSGVYAWVGSVEEVIKAADQSLRDNHYEMSSDEYDAFLKTLDVFHITGILGSDIRCEWPEYIVLKNPIPSIQVEHVGSFWEWGHSIFPDLYL